MTETLANHPELGVLLVVVGVAVFCLLVALARPRPSDPNDPTCPF